MQNFASAQIWAGSSRAQHSTPVRVHSTLLVDSLRVRAFARTGSASIRAEEPASGRTSIEGRVQGYDHQTLKASLRQRKRVRTAEGRRFTGSPTAPSHKESEHPTTYEADGTQRVLLQDWSVRDRVLRDKCVRNHSIWRRHIQPGAVGYCRSSSDFDH